MYQTIIFWLHFHVQNQISSAFDKTTLKSSSSRLSFFTVLHSLDRNVEMFRFIDKDLGEDSLSQFILD